MYEMRCWKVLPSFLLLFFGFSIKAQRFLSGRGSRSPSSAVSVPIGPTELWMLTHIQAR